MMRNIKLAASGASGAADPPAPAQLRKDRRDPA